MHVSRQPNTERWVQSNSPFSLVLRDRVDSKLAVAWSKLAMAWSNLLAKAMWNRGDWLREQWDGEAGEWECEWLGSVCEGETVSESVRVRLLCVRERVRVSESGEWFSVRRYFWKYPIGNRLPEPRFPCLPRGRLKTIAETEFLRLSFTLSKPSLWGLRSMWSNSMWRVHVEHATWNLTTSRDKNRALKARFRGPKSSLWGSSC